MTADTNATVEVSEVKVIHEDASLHARLERLEAEMRRVDDAIAELRGHLQALARLANEGD